MENVIVTGANGFIGKTLVNALLAKAAVSRHWMSALMMCWRMTRASPASAC